MHEVGYVESLLPVLERRAAGRTVTRLGVRAGVLHRLVPASFQQAFDLVAAGTVAEGASVELEQVPVRLRCLGCGAEGDHHDPPPLCPACGAGSVVHAGGDDFILHWVAYAADDGEPVPGEDS